MRHRLINVLPATNYDFSGVAIGQSVLVPLAQNIDVSEWGGGTLLVRVHSNGSVTGSYFTLVLFVVAPTDEDPSTWFIGDIVSTITVAAVPSTAPFLARSRMAANAGSAVTLALQASPSPQGGQLNFKISVDLYLEERSAGWTPADLGSKLTLWLNNPGIVVDTNNTVSDWTDASTTGTQSFAQPTSGSRPFFNHTNGFLAPNFNGTSKSMKCASPLSNLISAGSYHLFVVFRIHGVSGASGTPYLNDGVIADQAPTGNWGLYLKNNSGSYEAHGFHSDGTSKVAVATGLKLDADTLVEWSFDGTNIRCRVGTGTTVPTPAGNVGVTGNTLGLGFGAAGGQFLNGSIAAIIVCNQYLSSTDVRNVRDYLSSRYGVLA